MAERVVPIKLDPEKTVNFYDREVSYQEILQDKLGNPRDSGWYFACGDPEYWKYADRTIVPGRKALDLGMGHGRSSVPFALRGMEVTAYEVDPNSLIGMRAAIEALGLPISIIEEDLEHANLGKDLYDTVLMAQCFNHSPSKALAFEIMDKAIRATKKGGYIWFRASGKDDENWQLLHTYVYMYPNEVQRIDDDVFLAPCACSGEYRIEPQLAFEPMEVAYFFTERGLKIIHSQVITETGRANIMYGENWNPEQPRAKNERSGMISFLLQK